MHGSKALPEVQGPILFLQGRLEQGAEGGLQLVQGEGQQHESVASTEARWRSPCPKLCLKW